MTALHVLIVDSDTRMVDQLVGFLSRRGHTAVGHGAAAEAIAALEGDAFDVAMVDTALDGAMEICAAARTLVPCPELVLLSTPAAEARTLALFGVARVLNKPFSGRALLGVLRELNEAPAAPVTPAVVGPSQGGERLQLQLPPLGQGGMGSGAVDNPLMAASLRRPMRARPPKLMTIMHKVGDLSRTPFPALLYKLFANQSTGLLRIYRSGSERTIFFYSGEPVYALSDSATDSLGAILVDLGYLQLHQLNVALEARAEGQPLGQALLSRGLVTSEQLLQGLDRQVYDRVLSCFSFTSGHYSFVEDTDWLGEVKVFPQNPIQLIRDGVQRFIGPNVLSAQLQPHLRERLVRTAKFAHFQPHFPVTSDEARLLEMIDGTRTLQDLTLAHRHDLMGLLRLVWSLRLADMVDFHESASALQGGSETRPPMPSRLPTPHMELADESPEPEPSDLEEERRRLSQTVLSFYVRLGYEDHWQLLGVERDSDAAEIENALQAILVQMPEAQFELLRPAVRQKAAEVRRALQQATEVLLDPGARAHYLRRVEGRRELERSGRRLVPKVLGESADGGGVEGGSVDISSLEKLPTASAPVRPPANPPTTSPNTEIEARNNKALLAFRRSREAAAEGRWKDAYGFIKAAGQLNPNNPEITVFTSWVAYHLPYHDRARQVVVCRARIEQELASGVVLPEAHVFLGIIEEGDGHLERALDHYRAALLLDAGLAEALVGLKRVRERVSAAEDEGDDDLMSQLKGQR